MPTKKTKSPSSKPAAAEQTSTAETAKPPTEPAEPRRALSKAPWDKDTFYSLCQLTDGLLERAGMTWEALAEIYADHLSRRDALDVTARYVAERLRALDIVHSVRVRIKDGAHLVRKIIRKCAENPERIITVNNYRTEITDLIGIRAIHLSKEEWQPIHEFIQSEWDMVDCPVAYVREGDHPAWTEGYTAGGCEVKLHPRQYRSVHYVIKSALSRTVNYVEIQVRTIFEEGWSEIDHRINYPEAAHSNVGVFLGVLNRLAGSADEMGTFINRLATDLKVQSQAVEAALGERDAALARVEELVSKLEMGRTERAELERELKQLRQRNTTPAGYTKLFVSEPLDEYRASDTLSLTGLGVAGASFPASALSDAFGSSADLDALTASILRSDSTASVALPAFPSMMVDSAVSADILAAAGVMSLSRCKRCSKVLSSSTEMNRQLCGSCSALISSGPSERSELDP